MQCASVKYFELPLFSLNSELLYLHLNLYYLHFSTAILLVNILMSNCSLFTEDNILGLKTKINPCHDLFNYLLFPSETKSILHKTATNNYLIYILLLYQLII